MKIFLLLSLFLLSVNSYAQTIKNINYVGMVHISKAVALRMLDFEEGSDVDEETIDNSIKKYFKQGYFEDIYAQIDDGNLTYTFKEKPIISKVVLKGWKENDDDTLDTVVKIKKGTLYNEEKLEDAKKRIIEAISHDGKIDSVVEVQSDKLENGSVKVTFVVSEGEKIIIEKLDYNGAKQLDTDEFDPIIANKEHQFMGWFWGRNDGKMSLADLEYDNLRIRDYYMQNGYLDANIKPPFVRVDFNNYTADMSYQIDEGEAYIINSISFKQIKKVVKQSKIKEIVKLTSGEVFNIKTFREDAQRIKTLIADKSYAFVQVVPDLKKNKKDHSVDVVFKIIPGDKVKIRNVVISGNDRTLDRIIRREIYLGPGDMYSLTDLKDSRNSLGRLGFFDGNTIEEKRIDNQTMDLVVKVKEAPTGNIQIGGGYGSYGGLLLSISVNDRNIWGSGINVGIKAEKSQMSQNYSFNISNQRLNDSDFSGNFSIYKSISEYNDYKVYSDGFSLGAGHKFSRHTNGYLGYNYSKNSYDVFNSDLLLASSYGYSFESYSKSSVTISASFDNTDDYYLPREGFVLSQSFEKSGLGSDANFLKSRTKFSAYYGLDDIVGFDVIARYKSRYNAVTDNGFIPVSERFYMGGLGSVRGYESYSLSPVDSYSNNIGGKQTFSNNAELSFPLVPKAKMRLVTYVDWGFIGDESLTEISRGGYGTGIEWFSPVGPIQLMFSKALNKKDGDRTTTFDFMMGQRF